MVSISSATSFPDVATHLEAEQAHRLGTGAQLSTTYDPAFENMTELARRLTQAPTSIVSIIHEASQHQSFKSIIGAPPHLADMVTVPLTHSYCKHVCQSGEPLVIRDARTVAMLQDNGALHDYKIISYLGVPVHCPDGTPVGALAVMDGVPRDWSDADLQTLVQIGRCVDDQIALKDALGKAEVAEERAQDAAAAREQFLAHMAHEIRTPLNGIMGSVDVLASMADYDDPSGDFTRMLQTVDQSTQGLLRILNDALDMAKIDAGKLDLDEAPFDLRDLGEDVTKLFTVTAEAKGVGLICEWDNVPMAEMRFGDGFRLRQILNNLMSNAIKFTDQGEIRLTITGEPNDIWITLQDTGCGMSTQQMDAVFEAYTQADKSVARRKGGTGLGLSIVRNLVQMMNGQITVSGAEGKGTRFDVRLTMPVVEFEALPEIATFSADDGFENARVLVADDSPVNRLVLGKLLTGLNAEVVFAENGAQALEETCKGGFDWLLLDIQMPDMSGVEVVTAMTESGAYFSQNPGCHTVAVTANVFPEQIAGYLEAGFDACLGKPLRRDDLIALAMQLQS
ncbi:MAG: ATP-binding protein [Shimia sp.]|uniref:ATP-binding protein n=1 Tax=Shimia sp. TaxID=1954381 RepID=UPI004059A193